MKRPPRVGNGRPFFVATANVVWLGSRSKCKHFAIRSWFDESGGQTASRLFLPFWPLEIILSCFQTGRMSQWAQAHFFVGRDGWRNAGASMPGVPAVEGRSDRKEGSRSKGSTRTSCRAWFEAVGVVGWSAANCLSQAKYRSWNRMQLEKVREAAERVAGSL